MKRLVSIFLITAMLFTFGFTGAYADEAAHEVSGDIVYFEEDFTGNEYELGTSYEKTHDLFKEHNNTTSAYWGQTHEIKETESGKRYLSIQMPSTASNGGYYYNFAADAPFTKGNLVVEMKVRVGSGYDSHIRDLIGFRDMNDSNNQFYVLGTKKCEILATSYNSSRCIYDLSGAAVKNDPEVVDGFWNIKVVLSRASEEETWKLGVYDAYNDNVLRDTIDTKKSFSITRVLFTLVTRETQGKVATTDITDLKIYSPEDVTFTVEEAYNSKTGTVKLRASEAIDPASIAEADAVVIKNGETEYAATATAEGNILTVNVIDKLPESGTYYAELNGIKSARHAVIYNKSVSFNATIVQEDVIYFEEDFTGNEYELGTSYEKTHDLFKEHNNTTSAYWGQTHEIKETESGKRYLSIQMPSTASNGGYYYNFAADAPFTKGNLVVEMKVRVGSGYDSHIRDLIGFRDMNDSNNQFYVLGTKKCEILATSYNSSRCIYDLSGAAVKNDPEVVDGFWNIKVVLSRASEEETWKLGVYDAYNDNVLRDTIDTKKSFSITRVLFTLVTREKGGVVATTDITDLKVYSSVNTKIFASNVTFKLDDKDITSINATGSELSVSASVTCSSSQNKNAIAILAVYDKDDNLKGLKKTDVTASLTESYDLNLSVENLKINNQYKAKLMFMENFDTIRPLRAAEVLSSAGQFR